MMGTDREVEFLSIEPALIDTPDYTYKKFKFLYVNGDGQIIARSGYPVRNLTGTLIMTGPATWRLDGPTESWMIDRTRGCACTGQPIIPKA